MIANKNVPENCIISAMESWLSTFCKNFCSAISHFCNQVPKNLLNINTLLVSKLKSSFTNILAKYIQRKLRLQSYLWTYRVRKICLRNIVKQKEKKIISCMFSFLK